MQRIDWAADLWISTVIFDALHRAILVVLDSFDAGARAAVKAAAMSALCAHLKHSIAPCWAISVLLDEFSDLFIG